MNLIDIAKRIMPEVIKNIIRQFIMDVKLKKATPVLVYQMGKVGSSSIYHSLRKQYPGVVFHTHSFSASHPNPQIRNLYHRAVSKGEKLDVISLVREPVGRNVSAFFQNFERETGVSYGDSNFSIDELRDIFIEKYDHNIPLKWFDENIRANFGIDVESKAFPLEGVATYSHENTRLLVMRCEIGDEEKVKAVKEFLDMEKFYLQNTNVGDEKNYAADYNAFKKNIRLPKSYIDKMCGSRYFNHFYSKYVAESVKKKWGDG